MIADYLMAEELILARLEAEIPEVKSLAAADLAGVAESAQRTPAIHVLYAGDRVPGGGSVDEGNYHLIRQQWLVVVAVRSARGQRTGEGARDEAGPLISRVLAALSGWRVADDLGRLRRVGAPRPAFTPGGYAYFPIQFELDVLTETHS